MQYDDQRGMTATQQRLERALGELGGAREAGELFAELVGRYQEPHRHYHTLEHIDACLQRLDRFGATAQRPAEVELALWFHDVVYDPRRKDNEAQSAQLAADRLRTLGVDAAAIERITGYIHATAQHDADAGDSALVNDLDLGILGAERAAFERFEQQVRQEYAHVLSPLFRIGRSRVLKSFLARDRIYNVPEIRAELEARARANLTRRIAEL